MQLSEYFKICSLFIVLVEAQDDNLNKSDSMDFGYDDTRNEYGPSNWGKVSQNCIKKLQSPINLVDKTCVRAVNTISFTNFELKAEEVTMTNIGHTVEVRFAYKNDQRASISGPLLNNHVYNLLSMHFHWGDHDFIGSEHRVNFQSYAGEIHMVCLNSKYETLEEAKGKNDGVVVIATFFTVQNRLIPYELLPMYYLTNFQKLNNYLSYLPNLVDINSSVTLKGPNAISLLDVILKIPVSFYVYVGSLTTPTCDSGVIWIVNRLPVPISPSDLQNFRSLNSREGKILRNYRPLQPTGKRIIARFL